MEEPLVYQILTEETCHDIIRKKLKQDSADGLTTISYKIIPINSVNGYMGQYYKLKAVATSPEASFKERRIYFFAKTIPVSSSPLRDFGLEYGSFRKEVILYNKVFPKMFYDSKERCIPECFLAYDDEAIVLEDMNCKGYFMTDKFVPFDLDHCKIMMKVLARFHAKSFIFEERYKIKLNEEYPSCCNETLWPLKGDKGVRLLDAAVKGIVSMMELMPELSEGDIKVFKRKFKSFVSNHATKLLPSEKFRNVMCHGDLWANNILFKYEDNRPIDCSLIDFQLVRYNPPAHDVMCFLQFTTTKDFRKQHSAELFKIYHDTLSHSIEKVGMDITTLCSWEEFIRSVNELRVTHMCHGVLNIPIMLLESNAADKYFSESPQLLNNVLFVDRTSLICEQFETIPAYRSRMIDALLELHEHL